MDTQVRTALQLIVQDRDEAQRRADDQARGRYARDDAAAEVRGYNMALATFAGVLGFTERRRLELDLATGIQLADAQAVAPMGGWEPRS